MATEHGPFETEAEALTTQAAAMVRAAQDARLAARQPGAGAGDETRLKIMTDACEEHGVTLGAYEQRFLAWLARGETGHAVALAGIIRRAHEAGLRAARIPEGSVTSWAVRYPVPGGEHSLARCPDEGAARSLAAHVPGATVMRWFAGAWTEAPEPGQEGDDDRRAGTRLPIGEDLNLLIAAARMVITGRDLAGRDIRVICASGIQRHLRVGFAKAARLIGLLEQQGIIRRLAEPGWQYECLVPADGLDAALERITQSAGLRTCRHCHGVIVPCAPAHEFPVCKGWKHTRFLDSMPVGAHYCDGRSINPSAEPVPETAKENGDA